MDKPQMLLVCTKGKKCPKRGSKDTLRELHKLAERLDFGVEIKKSGCMKLCKFGPSVMSLPDGVTYGGVTKDRCQEVLEAHAAGRVLEELVVTRKRDKQKRKKQHRD